MVQATPGTELIVTQLLEAKGGNSKITQTAAEQELSTSHACIKQLEVQSLALLWDRASTSIPNTHASWAEEKGEVVGEVGNRSSSAMKAWRGSCATAVKSLTDRYYVLDQ